MKCPACGTDNGDGSSKCAQCQAALPVEGEVEFPQADRVPPMRLILVSVGVMALMLALLVSALSPRALSTSRMAAREDPPVNRTSAEAPAAATAAVPSSDSTPAAPTSPAGQAAPAPEPEPPVAVDASAGQSAQPSAGPADSRAPPPARPSAARSKPAARVAEAKVPVPVAREAVHREAPPSAAENTPPARTLDDLLK